MTTEEQHTAPEDFEKFASQALRRNKLGSYEQLLCQHLIKSVASDPMEKIRLVTEAAYMVPDTPVDKDALEIIHIVSTCFNECRKDIVDPFEKWMGRIIWGFYEDEENYKKYIIPWLDDNYGLFYRSFSYGDREKEEKLKQLSGYKYFYAICGRAHIATLVSLESRFLMWAIPQIMAMFEQLSKLVNPDLYDSILEKMRV